MRAACLVVSCVFSCAAGADETVALCYNWGCAREATVAYAEDYVRGVGDLLQDAESPAHERELLAIAVARMLAWAAERSPIGRDRAGNFDDFDVDGRMDCIDHSTNTTRFLVLFERRGWLRFHAVREIEERHRFFIFPHRAAVIQERLPDAGATPVPGDGAGGAYFAVDSWHADPGTPVLIVPLEEWTSGAEPDVD